MNMETYRTAWDFLSLTPRAILEIPLNRQHILPQLILRSWPFPRGAGRIIDHLFSKLAFEDEVATVRSTDGFIINVLPNELIGRHIYLTGEFDRSTVEVLLNLSKPNDILLDIGANIGYVSACFLQNVPASKVVAVEPQPKIVDLLRLNLQQFGGTRHTVCPVAISDQNMMGWMDICNSNRGASKVIPAKSNGSVEIELWSPTRLIESLKEPRIDLVKIDVEGQEETVLKACQAEFEWLRPRAILFEGHTHSAAPNGSIGQIFSNIGYRIFGVKKRLTRLEYVSIHSADDCVYNDYLAVQA